jgi:hypothetical protein
MAEGSAGSDGEDRGHPATFPREHPVTDGEHAAMQHVQPPALQAMADRAAADSQAQDLVAGYDAVLALGEPRDRGVDRRAPTFGPHDGLNEGLDAHRSMLTASV